jgi:4-hydroxybenzoate polyprenyltransferase
MDVVPDTIAGRRTTAVCIGVRNSKALLACFLLTESLILYLRFNSPIAALFLGGAGLAFVYDALIRKDKLPNIGQMKFLLLSWNAVALASMWWIWNVGLFVK